MLAACTKPGSDNGVRPRIQDKISHESWNQTTVSSVLQNLLRVELGGVDGIRLVFHRRHKLGPIAPHVGREHLHGGQLCVLCR